MHSTIINFKTFFVTCGFVSMLFSVGCGSNYRDSLSASQEVNATIAALGDAAMEDSSFASVFVAGTSPANRKDYATCNYEVVGEPSISGDEATAEVQVTTGVSDGSNSDKPAKVDSGKQETRNVTWSLSKEGDEWKIKDAPLE
ncbi:hypothetical protein [Rubinisphaera italica]|uniref:DUF4878 domain-containing protein n=1 Tax=Rubinisphaera italica TaxID=2527969 RepID=A0A5C5XBK6_9PLAN|nr:hypothetical protein [Rubinisphaera italica]TWT60168.1 hypothetical protein Pan54_08820 [Rubinisphaera italica]